MDGILADLGVASPQIDDPARGFSYRQPGPLDMRMDPTRGQPASALVNRLSEREMAEALLELGDETDAPRIARLIVERRAIKPITTTQQLTEIVCEARDFTLKRAAGGQASSGGADVSGAAHPGQSRAGESRSPAGGAAANA